MVDFRWILVLIWFPQGFIMIFLFCFRNNIVPVRFDVSHSKLQFNPLPAHKILDLAKLIQIEDDIFKVHLK